MTTESEAVYARALALAVYARALVLAPDLRELAPAAAADLRELSEQAARALTGDERAKLHLAAQFRSRKARAASRAYLESAATARAIGAAMVDVAVELGQAAMIVAAEFLAAAIGAAFTQTE